MNFDSYHREKIRIIRDILEVAKLEEGGITKTAIMYKANLSHDQMKHYVRILTENNLLCYNIDTQRFESTDKAMLEDIETTIGSASTTSNPTGSLLLSVFLAITLSLFYFLPASVLVAVQVAV